MSTSPAHMRSNYDIMDFTLFSVDMASIDVMTTAGRCIVGSSIVP